MSKKKFSSLFLSNKAHQRLEKKHKSKMYKGVGNYDAHQQKALYHGACVLRQDNLRRVLTFQERRKVYDDVIKTFY